MSSIESKKMILELESGEIVVGKLFGYKGIITGELVFQTGITGYNETLTDPSYANQIIVFTTPLINNYGIPPLTSYDENNLLKYYESNKPSCSAIIVQEYTENSSHYLDINNNELRNNSNIKSLNDWLVDNKIIGLSGIDTRYLTKIIREQGVCRARIYPSNLEDVNLLPQFLDINDENLVDKVSCDKLISYKTDSGEKVNNPKILFFDCGAKNNQLRSLINNELIIDRVPYDFIISIEDLKLTYNGIFISNGPGTPEKMTSTIALLKEIVDSKLNIPIFGICLGHQILGLSAGYSITKMKYGNRGQNIPVVYIDKNNNPSHRCLITSQNHGFKVNLELEDNNFKNHNKNWEPLFINANDNTNEGLCHKDLPYFSVQFHPEANPGPKDSEFLFTIFSDLVNENYIEKEYNKSQNISIKDRISRIIYPDIVFDKDKEEKAKINKGKIIILGSGGLSIGQAGEFDYSGSQAIKAFKESGLETILINPNVATIQTSKGLADKIYYNPINLDFVTQIIKDEKPNYLSVSFGGQTALNCGMQLYQNAILEKYNVQVLGTHLENVIISEDREKFKKVLSKINLETPPSSCAKNINDAIKVANKIGYPVLVRAGFCLGGQGSGFAKNDNDLKSLVESALQISETVIIDKSLKGWKELEYEIVRDKYGNCISVCNMENLDPLGVHTGESVVVAPSQTLNDEEYQILRSTCFKIVNLLHIVGECNVQFALDPNSNKFYIIEMNARLSRSSALASKATGYPLAFIGAKLALGYSLYELKNKITMNTCACFEPSLDYLVVKIPRWDLDKFPNTPIYIGSHMKSVGEVMSIGRNFKETIQKALRMVNDNNVGFHLDEQLDYSDNKIYNKLKPHPKRLNDLFNILYRNLKSVGEINNLTGIDRWFLHQINDIVNVYKKLSDSKQLDNELIRLAKKSGFSDKMIGDACNKTENIIMDFRYINNILPNVKQIDTVAAEFPCVTNYLYLTYNSEFSDSLDVNIYNNSSNKDDDNLNNYDANVNKKSVMVLGSGVYRIGSSVEFDWCCVSCIRELRKLNISTIMINNNPETVSTDYDEADKLYFEEISVEVINDIYNIESGKNKTNLSSNKISSPKSINNLHGIILSMGGQAANNIAMDLHKLNLKILGTEPEMIDMAENRFKFSRLLDSLKIDQPTWKELTSVDEAKIFCENVEYPCLIRPSYVLSGAAMKVVYDDNQLDVFLKKAKNISPNYPVVISKFIDEGKEIEVDAVAENGKVVILTISEHVENAGVHSGDATLVLPAQDLNENTINRIRDLTFKIGCGLNINGPFNMQLIAKDDKLKVIECNLRVSRSFPFASKTLDINMIHIATNIICRNIIELNSDDKTNILNNLPKKLNYDRVGVKVAQFSFHRLEKADINLGVEMSSTGEVAGFGANRNIAYLKALGSTGFKIPKIADTNVFIVIDKMKHKEEFEASFIFMNQMGWNIYYLDIDSKYYSDMKNTYKLNFEEAYEKIKNKGFDLIINVYDEGDIQSDNLELNTGTQTDMFKYTLFQYKIRRLSLDFHIPIMINIKTSKLLIESIYYCYQKGTTLDTFYDKRESNTSNNNSNDSNNSNNSNNNQNLCISVIENSSQCISYQENIEVELPKSRILFTDKHIITSEQFDRNLLRKIFLRSQEIMMTVKHNNYDSFNQILKNKIFGLLFYTPSTRTRCSFECAIKKMGGEVLNISEEGSSVKKGESLKDTIKSLEQYCDGLIVRCPNDTSLFGSQYYTDVSLINAGDNREHPTQALIDLFTIREERGTVNNLKIAIVGDLLHSRTVKSLIELLLHYNVIFYFVSNKDYALDELMIQKIEKSKKMNKHINYHISEDINEVIPIVDVIYMTRMQKERHQDNTNNNSNNNINTPNDFISDKLSLNVNNFSKAKPNTLILHPLPRNDEIDVMLDNDPRSIYFKQMKYGLYVRMALLELLYSR